MNILPIALRKLLPLYLVIELIFVVGIIFYSLPLYIVYMGQNISDFSLKGNVLGIVPTNQYQSGIASWYGSYFHGLPTASTEPYDMYALTAAHKTLPLGTSVKVTNIENRKSVIVRINDRGPFVGERIIDLSWEAARQLNIIDRGLVSVVVEIIE